MANLGIESATHGYDKAGLQHAISKLNTDVFQRACNVLDTEVGKCRSAVDAIWKGKSADAFKAKLERDTATIQQDLKNMEDALESQFAAIAAGIDNSDSELADSINAM